MRSTSPYRHEAPLQGRKRRSPIGLLAASGAGPAELASGLFPRRPFQTTATGEKRNPLGRAGRTTGAIPELSPVRASDASERQSMPTGSRPEAAGLRTRGHLAKSGSGWPKRPRGNTAPSLWFRRRKPTRSRQRKAKPWSSDGLRATERGGTAAPGPVGASGQLLLPLSRRLQELAGFPGPSAAAAAAAAPLGLGF